jgi:predicted dehydrogenase
MNDTCRAAVIGMGLLGGRHASFLSSQPGYQVAALADIRKAATRKAASSLGAIAYEDYRRMLEEVRPDLVVVATPDALHREPVLACAGAGVPAVILEKPMATAVREAEEMLRAVEQSGTRLYINYANRGSALDRATHYVVRQGLLGDLVYGDIHLDDSIVVPTAMWGNRSREWTAGSSTAHFLLSHVVDFLRWIAAPAEVTEVYGITQKKVLGFTPDLYDAFLSFDNGMKFRVKAEWIRHIDGLVEFAFSFSGSEGSLKYIKRPGHGEAKTWRANVSRRVTRRRLLKHTEKLAELGIPVELKEREISREVAGFEGGKAFRGALERTAAVTDDWRVVRAILDGIEGNSPSPPSWSAYGNLPTGYDGLRQTRIVCAIEESAELGRPVNVAAG